MLHSTGDWGWDKGQQRHWEHSHPLCTEGGWGNGPHWPPHSWRAIQDAEGQKAQTLSSQEGLRKDSTLSCHHRQNVQGLRQNYYHLPLLLCVSYSTPWHFLMHSLLHLFVMLKLLCLADSFIFSHMPIPPPSLLLFLFTSHTFPVLTQHHHFQPRALKLVTLWLNQLSPPSANELS